MDNTSKQIRQLWLILCMMFGVIMLLTVISVSTMYEVVVIKKTMQTMVK